MLCKLWFLCALIKWSNPLVVPASVLAMAWSYCAQVARGPWATFNIRFLLLVPLWDLCSLHSCCPLCRAGFSSLGTSSFPQESSRLHLPVFLHFPGFCQCSIPCLSLMMKPTHSWPSLSHWAKTQSTAARNKISQSCISLDLMYSCTVEFSPPSGVRHFFVFQMECSYWFACESPSHWTECGYSSVCCRRFLKIGEGCPRNVWISAWGTLLRDP